MAAVDALTKIVGKKRVLKEKEVLESFQEDASFEKGKMPACVVRPRNSEDVLKIVRLANEKGLSLVPCSSGGPRTRGDTLPAVEGSVMVDLSMMDAVMRIDKRNKVAMVEPGVSFGALQDAAAAEDLRVAMPRAPRKTKSVVGSLLEREPTTLPKYHWDMSDPLCCLELIFGAGDLFRTGAAAGPGTLEQQWASGQAQKSPMGPSQNDMAKIIQGAQGTMGIVTWASVKLEQKPKIEKEFLVSAQSLEELVPFAYSIVKPRLPDLCLLLNRTDVTAILGKNTPKEAFRDLAPWMLFYSVSGYEHFPEDRVEYLEKDIGDLAHAKGLRPRQEMNGLDARHLLSLASRPCGETYWKEGLAGGFQDIFFLTTLDRAPEFVGVMEKEAEQHGFPIENIGMYIQPIQQGRNCHLEFTLMYDPGDQEQTRVVKELLQDASKCLVDRGGFFSRPYGPWSDLAYNKAPDTVAALRKVKDILDPNGVMNPGKLCFEKGV